MKLLLKDLSTNCLPYNPECDPTRQSLPPKELWQEDFTLREWTIGPRAVSTTRKRLTNPETTPEGKPKKAKEKNERKPYQRKKKNLANSIPGGEGSKDMEVEESSVKLEPTEDAYSICQENTKQGENFLVIQSVEAKLKQEAIQLLESAEPVSKSS